MRRYHSERHLAERRQRQFKAFTGIDRPVGVFRKKRLMDCGKSRCLLCSWCKFPKRTPTRQEMLAFQVAE